MAAATRYVTHSRKANAKSEKEIEGVRGEAFGYLKKADVHDQIQAGTHIYYSRTSEKDKDGKGIPDALILAKGTGPDRYIATEKDRTVKNNLLSLPDW